MNEKKLVEPLLDRLWARTWRWSWLPETASSSPSRSLTLLEARKIGNVIAWRRLKGRANPSDVLTVKDRIDVEGPEHLRVIYKGLRAMSESLNGRVKARLAYSRLTWQGIRKRKHPRVPGSMRGLRRRYRRLPHGQTGTSVQHRPFRLTIQRTNVKIK